jgi:hypothetical protein
MSCTTPPAAPSPEERQTFHNVPMKTVVTISMQGPY